MTVDICTGLNCNRIVSGVAYHLCRLGNKQIVNRRFAVQGTIELEVSGINGTDNHAFHPDNQLIAADVAFDAAVDMHNAVADNVSLNLGIFTDDAGHRRSGRTAAETAGEFKIDKSFNFFILTSFV